MGISEKLVPKRRFKEFVNNDAWEQRKLIDLGKSTGGTSIESEFSEGGVYKVISIGSYSENSIYTDQGIRAIDSENTKRRILNKGDLTMILNDKTASGNIIGRVLLIEKSGVYVYNQRTERIEIDSKNYDSVFIYQMLNAPRIREKIIKQSQGNTQIYVNWPKISLTEYSIPKIEEQREIGEYFHNIDNLITLHQRKLEKIKALKSAYLSEMFPAEGENKPKRRFAGFTNDWERCKWNEAFITLSSNSLSRAELNTEQGVVKNVHYGDVLIKYGEILNVLEEQMPYITNQELQFYDSELLQNGDIIIADAAEDQTVGKCCEVAGLDIESIVSGLHTIPCRPIKFFSTGYLGYYMNSCAYQDQLIPLIQGTKISSISKSALKDTNIIYPGIVEQEKIGTFFINLDTLISRYQQTLEEFQNIKKAFLNEMFI